jgi:hypothetical protein
MLAVEDSLGAIRLVRSETGEELVRLEAPEQTRLLPRGFTPDGRRLVAVGIDTQALHVWDLGALRRGLIAIGLSGDGLPEPTGEEPTAIPAPLVVTTDMGNLLRGGKP